MQQQAESWKYLKGCDLKNCFDANAFISQYVTIGIDLTSDMAHLTTGMGNALHSHLYYLKKYIRNSRLLLFTTDRNHAAFAGYVSQRINIVTADSKTILSHLSDLDALYFPFNEITTSQSAIPSIVAINDLIPEYFQEFFGVNQRRHIQEACHFADYILTISEYTKYSIGQYYEIPLDKVYVCHIPIIIDKFSGLLSNQGKNFRQKLPGQKYILYPAAGRPHKNHGNLFAALKIIKPDIQLVLTTGETHATERLKMLRDKAVTHGITDRVRILGHVSEIDYLILLREAEALIFPSLAEGYGIPVIEAMASRCPVVCSNTTCLPEIAGDAALYFDPEDPQDIASKVNLLLSDQQLQEYLKAKGVNNALRFVPDPKHTLLAGFKAAVSYARSSSFSKAPANMPPLRGLKL